MVKHELRLASFELLVISWKLKSVSWNSKIWVQTHELGVQIYELPIQIPELRVKQSEKLVRVWTSVALLSLSEKKQPPEICYFIYLYATLLKRDSNTGVFLWNLWNFQEHLF